MTTMSTPIPTRQTRARDALAIEQGGACNPSAIVRSLKEHIGEMRINGAGVDEIRNDPSLRLIVHQLAHLFRITAFDSLLTYEDVVQQVKDLAEEPEK